MGTPDFAVPALEMLHREGFDIAAVVSQPDKPKGRHGELSMPEVKKKALELGLTVLQPQKASDPDFIDTIRAMEPDAENIWAPSGGEPVIVRVKDGAY